MEERKGNLFKQAKGRAKLIREAMSSPFAKLVMNDEQKKVMLETATLLDELAAEILRLGGGYV